MSSSNPFSTIYMKNCKLADKMFVCGDSSSYFNTRDSKVSLGVGERFVYVSFSRSNGSYAYSNSFTSCNISLPTVASYEKWSVRRTSKHQHQKYAYYYNVCNGVMKVTLVITDLKIKIGRNADLVVNNSICYGPKLWSLQTNTDKLGTKNLQGRRER